ncbi:hypothetical protein ACLOJK_010602 [Asimina triloba]
MQAALGMDFSLPPPLDLLAGIPSPLKKMHTEMVCHVLSFICLLHFFHSLSASVYRRSVLGGYFATKELFQCSLLNLTEIADGTLCCAYQKGSVQPSVPSIRSEGYQRGRSPHKSTPSDRATRKNDEQKDSQLSDGNSSESSKQEQFIEVFRRIKASIAAKESASSKKRSSNPKVKESVESVFGVLSQNLSKEQLREAWKERKAKEVSTKEDFKLSRPPSNFVKRSPIRSTQALKQTVDESSTDGFPIQSTPALKESVVETSRDRFPAGTAIEDSELERVDTLKLTELKELAKSRGVKGYSKLKKGELMELLKGMMQS